MFATQTDLRLDLAYLDLLCHKKASSAAVDI